VIDGVVVNNDDEEFFCSVQRRYQATLKCVEAMNEFVSKNYHHTMSNSENDLDPPFPDSFCILS
jgi:beta-glucoside operon transcriptional antiterminator